MMSSRWGASRCKPALKSSVDAELQIAFEDSNWPTVVRLAEKRAKTSKDPYYDAIRICAEKELNSATGAQAILVAVDQLKKAKTPLDLATLELFEWAVEGADVSSSFSETFGPLRARWAKTNPGTPQAIQCLQACVSKWDLENAQQIAATLDKARTKASSRQSIYWNVMLMFLYSISAQASENTKRLFGTLALKQLERAAQLTESMVEVGNTDKGFKLEEEFNLYYKVLLTHGSKDDYRRQIQSPKLGAITLLKNGYQLQFLQALRTLARWGDWNIVFSLCDKALSVPTISGAPSHLASDWHVWKSFIDAAINMQNTDAALHHIQLVTNTYTSASCLVAAMYRKNVKLAILEMTFRNPRAGLLPNTKHGNLTSKVVQLGLFLEEEYASLSVFDDVKDFVGELSHLELDQLFLEVIPKMSVKKDAARSVALKTLACRLRYFLTTCPRPRSQLFSTDGDAYEQSGFQYIPCWTTAPSAYYACLEKNMTDAVNIHGQITSAWSAQALVAVLGRDPRADLVQVIGMYLLKLAGLVARREWSCSPLRSIRPVPLLQAVLLLDFQLRETPRDTSLRLVMVKLYLLLGCASYAFELWAPLDVKRTIQDALSPHFFDRLSTLSPGLFQSGRPPTDSLRSHYVKSLRNYHKVVWDGFLAGSYSSVLELVDFKVQLRRSCTAAMTFIEERRAARACGGKMEIEVQDLAIVGYISNETAYLNVTDNGPFSYQESPDAAAIHEYLQVGPELSNERTHLGLLAERFLDLISTKMAKEYKPLKPSDIAASDREFLLESLAHIRHSLAQFQSGTTAKGVVSEKLTSPEAKYFRVISLLATTLLVGLSSSQTDATRRRLSYYTSIIRATLSHLTNLATSSPVTASFEESQVFYTAVDMHTLCYLWETALATKKTATLALAYEQARATPGCVKTGLHNDVAGEFRALETVATKTLATLKGHIKTTSDKLRQSGWLDRVLKWMFGPENEELSGSAKTVAEIVGGRAGAEMWAAKVVESWRETMRGWSMVRMD